MQQRQLILGTAGHIDHGKTALVRALTGIDTDRLEAEKQRGISIDIGFAHLSVGDCHIGIVDVPGHERFIRNMLAGACGIDVAMLVVAADDSVMPQTKEAISHARNAGVPIVVAVNKCDLLDRKKQTHEALEEKVRDKLKFLDFAPVLLVSAKTGFGLKQFFPEVERVYAEYSRKVPTGKLNDCFARAIKKNPFSSFRGKFIKLFYSTQVKSCPPTFQCFVNYPEGIHFSYRRYLMNSLRQAFGFSGTPVRLKFTPRRSDH